MTLILVVFGTFLSGCNASRESICQEFPVAAEIDSLQVEIAALGVKPDLKRSGKAGRKIASVSAPPASPDAIQEMRETWMVWGEKALKQTQWAQDVLRNDKNGRKAIHSLDAAGLSLVSFHGFLEQRKWKKASAELERVEKNLKAARKIACEPEVSPKKRKK